MIKILCVGKIKEQYLNDLINDYLKRISKYHNIKIIELKDNPDILVEVKEIDKHFNNKDYNIALTIDGKTYDSIELARHIDKLFIINSNITFIVGGSNGIHSSILEKCNEYISFSNLTFPHGLFRGILLEQIYRSFKINNNETYHK